MKKKRGGGERKRGRHRYQLRSRVGYVTFAEDEWKEMAVAVPFLWRLLRGSGEA